MKVKDSDFYIILKRRAMKKIEYLYCTVSCTASKDDGTIKIMLFQQSAV